MNEAEYLAQKVEEQLEAGTPLVLVSILSLQGSTPRHSGAKMAVAKNGKSYGTIGGSLIEATVISESLRVFNDGKSKIISYDLTGKDTTNPGMICGGKVELLLDYLPASTENREFARCWNKAILHGRDFYLLTHFQNSGKKVHILSHAVLYPDGKISSSPSLMQSDAEKLKPEIQNISHTAVLTLKDTRVLVERIRRLKTLFCFGAGHVAVPTAHLAALVGFRVVVLDDRPEYANAERFPDAHEIRVIKDFNHVFEKLEIDADSYLIILTRGHQYDRAVLEQALKTSSGYIGMISSSRKREAIYNALIAQGITKEQLGKVHSPIGIDIGGETPEEIAVSIVAELISERSKQSA